MTKCGTDEFDPRCGSQGVDDDGHCVRCGLRVNQEILDESCPPGFLSTSPTKAEAEAPPVERIVAAAIEFDGMIYAIPPPARHHTILWKMMELKLPGSFTELRYQGFLTSAGRFVDRYEGCKIAQAAGQIREPIAKDMLTSEDVW